MLDLRIPTGMFFGATGLILVTLGVLSPETRASMTVANVNLYTGIAMLTFGVVMLALARSENTRSRNARLRDVRAKQ